MNFFSGARHRRSDPDAGETPLPWLYAMAVIVALSLAAWAAVILTAMAVWRVI